MWNKNIETYFSLPFDYEEAKIVVFGAPFDGTTSFRPGTRFAGTTMRKESYGLENYSPYQNRDLSNCPFFDAGELDLPFGNVERVLTLIEEQTSAILRDGKLPLMVGGEHLVTLGAVRAAVQRYPDLAIIHFDAHADLREEYLGETLSHASVLRRCYDLVGSGRIFQFGIRSGDRSEFLWAPGHVEMHRFDFSGLSETLAALAGRPIYFTLDLDVLDPSVFPGTGTPEAGGVSFMELLSAVLSVCQTEVVGCDINELSPHYDPSGASTAVALKILREMLIALSPQ